MAEHMTRPLSLYDFIALGQSVCIVANPHVWGHNVIKNEIPVLLQHLTRCDMTHTRIAATPLQEFRYTYDRRTGRLTQLSQTQLQAYIGAITQALASESNAHPAVVVNTSAVSHKLRDVSKTFAFTESQAALYSETIKCLEREAFRAAIVMGWCFAYDVMRWWIFNDKSRLQQFNAVLTKGTKRDGTSVYKAIVDYDDFYVGKWLGESQLIDIAESASLFDAKLTRNLRHYLDQRNKYAHATPTQPTLHQANAYIDHLVDIISSSPFA